jgi:hypothetical protein
MKKTHLTKFDRLMAAIAFAEEGEFTTAREFLREGEHSGDRPAKRPEMPRKQTARKSH